MGNQESSDSIPSGVQGICPEGWHVPSRAEWAELRAYTQNYYVCGNSNSYIAKALADSIGWWSSSQPCHPGYDSSTNNATGFSARPAGSYGGGVIYYFGRGTYGNDVRGGVNIWSSSAAKNNTASFSRISSAPNDNGIFSIEGGSGSLGHSLEGALSVRCLRDY